MSINNNHEIFAASYNDAILEAYNNLNTPLFDVVTHTTQEGERQMFDVISGVTEGGIDISPNRDSNMNSSSDKFFNTQYSAVTSKRIVNYLFNKSWATLVHNYDKERMNSDPTGTFVKAAINYMKQEQQKMIFKAISGYTIKSTRDLGANDFVEIKSPLINYVTGDSVFEALQKGKTLFDKNNVTEENRSFVCSVDVRNALLQESNVINSNMAWALGSEMKNGSAKALLGYSIVPYNNTEYGAHLPGKDDSFVQSLSNKEEVNAALESLQDTHYVAGYLVQKEAVKLAVNTKDLKAKIEELPHKHYATQIYLQFSLGGSRVNDKGVVAIIVKK